MPKAISLPRLALYTFVDWLLFQYDIHIYGRLYQKRNVIEQIVLHITLVTVEPFGPCSLRRAFLVKTCPVSPSLSEIELESQFATASRYPVHDRCLCENSA